MEVETDPGQTTRSPGTAFRLLAVICLGGLLLAGASLLVLNTMGGVLDEANRRDLRPIPDATQLLAEGDHCDESYCHRELVLGSQAEIPLDILIPRIEDHYDDVNADVSVAPASEVEPATALQPEQWPADAVLVRATWCVRDGPCY
jgi:hypothetical protein